MSNEQNYIFKGYIINTSEFDNGNKETSGEWLYFPTDKETVQRTFEKIGLPLDADTDKYFFDIFENGSVDVKEYFSTNSDIDRLNYLANMLSTLNGVELNTFEAAAEIEAPDRDITKELINIVYNLNTCYTLIPEMESWEDVGYYISEQKKYDTSVLGDLAEFIDYERFAKNYARNHDGYFINNCYLETDVTNFITVYDGSIEKIPKEYIVTQNGENIQYDYVFDYMFADSVDLATRLDEHFRNSVEGYSSQYPDSDQRMKQISDSLIQRSTVEIKKMLTDKPTAESAILLKDISDFDKKYPCDLYFIYQVKYDKHRDLAFEPLNDIRKRGLTVDKANYELIYTGELTKDTTLNSLWEYFNTRNPADFKGHSMSTSDVIVFRKDGTDKAYYCDKIGFAEVPEFNNVSIRSACYSNYKGYTAFVGADNNVYLGKSENYTHGWNIPAVYDNSDNSLIFISKNEKMFDFLSTQGWDLMQEDMIKQGFLTQADYAEFSRLQNTVLSSLDRIRNITFAGIPFNYLEAAEKTVEQNYNQIDGQINNKPTEERTQNKPSIKQQLQKGKKEHGEQGERKPPHFSPPEL